MEIKYTPLFIRSAKKYKCKNYPMDSIKACVKAIVTEDIAFLEKHKDHGLYKGVREMHIDRQFNDNWLLYYRFNQQTQVLELEIIDVGGHDKIRRIIGFKN